MPKKKTLARNPWTKEDVRELKVHSKAKTPVAKVAKAMKRTEGASDKRRRRSASVSVTDADDYLTIGIPRLVHNRLFGWAYIGGLAVGDVWRLILH